MIDKLSLLLILLAIIILIIIVLQCYNIQIQEDFTSIENKEKENKLFIKKTNNFKKLNLNSKYSVWIPEHIDDYFPTNCIITKDNKKPNTLGVLVKNENKKNALDKPQSYEINAISNKNYAYWRPIPNEGYKCLGPYLSKEYPSKYVLRCVPEYFVKKNKLKEMILKNKINSNDNGYEIWNLKKGNSVLINNLNNLENLDHMKNIYYLDESKCDVEKKLYIRYTSKYEKIIEHYDIKTKNSFVIWKPISPQNFKIIGNICLKNNINPNDKIKTIVVHDSCCKSPLNYGTKSIINFNVEDSLGESKSVSFWRPQPPKNFVCLGDVIQIGNTEPDYDSINCISLDYVKIIKNSYKMIWNNIDNNNSLSIWIEKNNLFNINVGYKPPNLEYILNEDYIKTDNDILDYSKTILINMRKNKNLVKEIDEQKLIYKIKNLFSSKLDVDPKRIKNIIILKNQVQLTIESKQAGTNQLSVLQIIEKLHKLFNISDIKIYDSNKNNYYFTFHSFEVKDYDEENIIIDNSLYQDKYRM